MHICLAFTFSYMFLKKESKFRVALFPFYFSTLVWSICFLEDKQGVFSGRLMNTSDLCPLQQYFEEGEGARSMLYFSLFFARLCKSWVAHQAGFNSADTAQILCSVPVRAVCCHYAFYKQKTSTLPNPCSTGHQLFLFLACFVYWCSKTVLFASIASAFDHREQRVSCTSW